MSLIQEKLSTKLHADIPGGNKRMWGENTTWAHVFAAHSHSAQTLLYTFGTVQLRDLVLPV